MKTLILFILFFIHSAHACDLQELRQEVQGQFTRNMPMNDTLGEQRAVTNIEDVQVTDTLMNLRGENFFITKLALNILWANGNKEKKEVLFASIVDLGTCKLEKINAGEIVGSSLSP